jgi:hypothetical protein
MKKIAILILVVLYNFLSAPLLAQGLEYYLPQDISYDPAIPTPKSILGHHVGEWHTSHDKLIHYMEAVAAASDRVAIERYGYTYENRPLLLLTVTSPDNHGNIEKIRIQHKLLCDPEQSSNLDITNMPVVVWMGYSVHGNEASGTNASLLAAYYLAAGQGPEIDDLLQNTVVLIDPSINPDGMNRFASWVNSHKSMSPDGNPDNLEHNEAWPGGRTNHYWFDLNRDWLPVQHPESKGRIAKFHHWKPNVLTDHHEMRSHRTFFFQPGVPSRNHPLSPENTFTLTKEIANYHAKALDEIGSLYYTEEGYDDYYYGKGSTYPDVNGAVGILFEQASVRGHSRHTVNGKLTFPFAIRNQLTTTLSTLQAAGDLRLKLLEHQREFYRSAVREAEQDNLRAYVFQSEDHGKIFHFLEMITRHQIDVFETGKDVDANGERFSAGSSYIVPLKQNQYRLVKAMFEKRTSFQDSLFYDVSAWTLPLAFNIQYQELRGRNYHESILGNQVSEVKLMPGTVAGGQSQYGYIFESKGYYAHRAIYRLFKSRLKVKVATEPMVLESGKTMPAGTVLIPVAGQKQTPESIHQIVQKLAIADGITLYALTTGFSSKGKSWGSPTVKPLKRPKVLVLGGDDISGYEVGEVWHLLDFRYNMDISIVSQRRLSGINLNEYNTLVMVDGQYKSFNKNAIEKLKRWIESGGQVIAWKSGAKKLSDIGLSGITAKKSPADSTSQLTYGNREKHSGAREIRGAIFEVQLDLTHPITYGLPRSTMPVFRNSELFFNRTKNPFTNPVNYTSDPVLSGYVHPKKLEELKNSPAALISHLGKGRIISFSDNPNFRAFWYGTNKLFMNAIFYGSIIESESLK